jgi:hypothetical protein
MFFFRVIILITQKNFRYTFRFVIILHGYDLSKQFNNVIDRDIETNFFFLSYYADMIIISCRFVPFQ